MNAELTEALAMHQEGRYADAARRYHAVLTREPNQVEALHLFGVMHHQCGHSARAIELLERAVSLRPGAAVFYANMAEAHRALGQFDHAVDCCKIALRLRPTYPEAVNNLALALQSLGRTEEAIAAFEEALRQNPGFGLARNNLGTLYRDLDRPEDARAAFVDAVAIEPTLGVARANLGQTLLDSGELEEGLTHCEEAVRLDPTLASAHNNLGNAYRLLGRFAEAHGAYAEAVRLAPKVAKVHVNRGIAFQADGKPEAAAASFERAVELAPDDPELWQSLAEAHVANEDYAKATPWLERLVALRPDRAHFHNELGWALQHEGRHIEAAACYHWALELRPNMLDALLNQGNLHEELGDLKAAEACYRQAREHHPNAPGPIARLANLLRGKLPEADELALRERLDDPELRDDPRCPLLFGLAQVADAHGDHEEAATALREANRISSTMRIQQGKTYDRDEHSRFVDRLIEAFTPELFERLAGTGNETEQPIFVVGMPRSGTTLVEQVLASHSRVHGAGELRIARQAFDAIPEIVGRNDGILACLQHLDAKGVQSLAELHLTKLREIVGRDHPDGSPHRIVDKMPDNYLYLGILSILFPKATFIHVRRDPRDIAFSCWMTSFRSIRWASEIDDLVARFQDHHRLTNHWRNVLPVTVHDVVYETLVDDFETEARRLLRAAGLDWEPGCKRFHETSRPVRTASVTQVRQPLYRKSVARWKPYESELSEFFERLPVEP